MDPHRDRCRRHHHRNDHHPLTPHRQQQRKIGDASAEQITRKTPILQRRSQLDV
jgi:hypothetical protein